MKVETRPSSIHGCGCFATEVIAEGELIGSFEGRAFESGDGPPADDHVLWLDGESGIDVSNELRHVNHSYNPNTAIDFDAIPPTLIALRVIGVDEEVTAHYGEEWERWEMFTDMELLLLQQCLGGAASQAAGLMHAEISATLEAR